VLDLMIPHVDGFEVLRALRARPATRDLPVIVVTAKDLTEETARGWHAAPSRSYSNKRCVWTTCAQRSVDCSRALRARHAPPSGGGKGRMIDADSLVLIGEDEPTTGSSCRRSSRRCSGCVPKSLAMDWLSWRQSNVSGRE